MWILQRGRLQTTRCATLAVVQCFSPMPWRDVLHSAAVRSLRPTPSCDVLVGESMRTPHDISRGWREGYVVNPRNHSRTDCVELLRDIHMREDPSAATGLMWKLAGDCVCSFGAGYPTSFCVSTSDGGCSTPQDVLDKFFRSVDQFHAIDTSTNRLERAKVGTGSKTRLRLVQPRAPKSKKKTLPCQSKTKACHCCQYVWPLKGATCGIVVSSPDGIGLPVLVPSSAVHSLRETMIDVCRLGQAELGAQPEAGLRRHRPVSY